VFSIVYLPQVITEDIPALPKTMKDRIQRAIEERLMTEPVAYGKPLRYELKGRRRLRVGDYRVIYLVDENNKKVTVTAIQHRRDIYN